MNTEKLRFKVTSSNKPIPVIGINETRWLKELEPNYLVMDICIQIYNKKQKIGYITGLFFDINFAMNAELSISDMFDAHSQEALEVYEALMDDNGELNYSIIGLEGNILYVERFYIDAEYRSQGIGFFVLSHFEDIIRYSLHISIGCIVIKPVPLEVSESGLAPVKNKRQYNLMRKKLICFYKQAGFSRIPKNDFMHINTDYRVRRLRVLSSRKSMKVE